MGRGLGHVAVQAGALGCLNLCKEWGLLDNAQNTLEVPLAKFCQEPSFAFQGQGLFHTAAREGQHKTIKLLIEWQIPGLDTRFTDWASFFHL